MDPSDPSAAPVAVAPPPPPANPWLKWLIVGGLVVAGAGAFYVLSHKGRRRKAGREVRKAVKRVKTGLLVAGLSALANRAAARAAEKVI